MLPGGWKFPWVIVWAMPVIWTPDVGVSGPETFYRRESYPTVLAFDRAVSGNTCGFSHLNTCHIGLTHINQFSPSLSSVSNALPKSSDRTRLLRAGGLRRASRSGCWPGWPWWPESWLARSLSRNACEGRRASLTPSNTPRIWNEGPVRLVWTADDVYFLYIPPHTHCSGLRLVTCCGTFWEKDRGSVTCSPW